jgi:hypothetical protein
VSARMHTVCVVMLGAVCATCWGQEPNDVRAVMAKCDAAIASMPKGWTQGAGDARRKILGQLFAEPDMLRLYLDSIFNPKLDPFVGGPGAEELAEEEDRKALQKVRQYLFLLVSEADRGSQTLRGSLLNVPADKRGAAIEFMDELLRVHRPAVFARAAQSVDDKFLPVVIETAWRSGDLRMVDALDPHFADKGAATATAAIRLRRHMPGQVKLMRAILASPELRKASDSDAMTSLEEALRYLIRAGHTDEAVETARKIIDPGSSHAGNAMAEILAGLDNPTARAYVLELFQEKNPARKILRNYLARTIPWFAAPKRVPFYLQHFGSRENWSYNPQGFVLYLTKHKDPAGLEWARKSLPRIRRKRLGCDIYVLQYLMRMGDEKAKQEMLTLARKPGNRRAHAIIFLHEAGMIDQLPKDWVKVVHSGTLVTLLRDERLRKQVDAAACLRPILEDKRNAEYAALLLLELGDEKGRDFLTGRLRDLPTSLRLFLAAKMYTRGDPSQLTTLVKGTKVTWLRAEPRMAAIKALTSAPAAERPAVARALAAVLLDIDGRVSSAAHEALVTLSGRKDVEFSPWATDDIRKAQAAVWVAWAAGL